MLKALKQDSEYAFLNKSIIDMFKKLSDQLEKTHDLMPKMDAKYQKNLAKNLMLYSIDVIQDSVVYDEQDLNKITAIKSYTQSLFLLDELLIEVYRNSKSSQSNADANTGNVSDIAKSTKSQRSKNSVSFMSQNDYNIDLAGISEDEIDKIYSTISTRINTIQK